MKIMTELTGMVGFASPNSDKALSRRRRLGIELLATLALAVSLIVAATAVSIGMAHAQACHGMAKVGHGMTLPATRP
jgi:hypothetical protein